MRRGFGVTPLPQTKPILKPSAPQPSNSAAFVALQYLLPQHFLSRIVRLATRSRFAPWKNFLIESFVRRFAVDMTEAAQPDPAAYSSFNEFFTRSLEPSARPVAPGATTVASPVDGTVSAAGRIKGNWLLQAKGREYTLEALLGGELKLADKFRGGDFATFYLAPHNYHRVHMPITGRLAATGYIPGRLFSVNEATAQRVPRLFTRNERLICLFDTDAGRLAVILVGALFVGSMSTVWAGEVRPAARRRSTWLAAPSAPVELDKGAELGCFNMGSTVIVLFEPGKMRWHSAFNAGASVRMGAPIGDLL
jgi:phosphatidylserine decarboxylase